MPVATAQAARVSDADRNAYARDGAIVLRGVLDPSWIARMRPVIDRHHQEHPEVTIWMSRFEPEFEAFYRDSGLAEIAGAMMGADRVNFFYDQLFVKLPKSDNPTPLHQDLPYWPVEGADIISIWVPFDAVTRANSVVQYVQGSHRWGRMFEPVPFSKDRPRATEVTGSAGYEEIDDPHALIAAHQTLWWELGPGDVLIHNPLTLHFATPNTTETEGRRAIALRYVGPDARFVDRPGNFMRRPNLPAFFPSSVIHDGAPVAGPDYPQVWGA